MHIAAIALGCLAFIALNLVPVWANILFGLALLVGLVIFIYLERKRE
jgi:phosphate/sulfate permease